MRICFLFIACVSVHLFAAETVEPPQPFYDGVKWGFCRPDSKASRDFSEVYSLQNRTILIPATYASCGEFKDGFARVTVKGSRDPKTEQITKDGEWGFINTQGKIVVPLEYEKVRDCSGFIAAVKKNEKWGVVDMNGRLILPLEFDAIPSFDASHIRAWKNEKYSYFDSSGKRLNERVYDLSDSFVNEFARVRRDGLCGWINKKGEEIGMAEYDDVHRFSGQLAGVSLKEKWGFVNEAGKIVIEPRWQSVRRFSFGLAAVKENGRWGYIDASGKMIIAPKFEAVSDFDKHGFASARSFEETKFGFINCKGEFAFEWRFLYSANFRDDGVASILTGIELLNVKTDGSSERVRSKNFWGRIEPEGGLIFEGSLKHSWSDFKIPFDIGED